MINGATLAVETLLVGILTKFASVLPVAILLVASKKRVGAHLLSSLLIIDGVSLYMNRFQQTLSSTSMWKERNQAINTY
jgi:hypothetical protein